VSTTPSKRKTKREPGKPGRPRNVIKKVEPIKVSECPVSFVRKVQQMGEQVHGTCAENQKPLESAIALWRVAQGMSLKRTAEETGLSRLTIRDLCIRNQATLSDMKAKFAAMYAQAASEYTELLFEKADRMHDDPSQLDNISPDRLALTVGIMTDQAAKLSGMASAIIEHRKGASIEDAAEMIAAAKARIAEKMRNQSIEAEVICHA
jgi:hypothetical protein